MTNKDLTFVITTKLGLSLNASLCWATHGFVLNPEDDNARGLLLLVQIQDTWLYDEHCEQWFTAQG